MNRERAVGIHLRIGAVEDVIDGFHITIRAVAFVKVVSIRVMQPNVKLTGVRQRAAAGLE